MLHRVQTTRKEGEWSGHGKTRATASHCCQALPELGATQQLKARKSQLKTKPTIPRFGQVGPPAMARLTAGSDPKECLLLGFDPPGRGFCQGCRNAGFSFAHQRILRVGVSSLSVGVCGDAWSAWTFGEGLKRGYGPSGRVSCITTRI